MDRLEAMQVFARVAGRRSFSLAAQDLGLPASTVTDAVKQLEARLGARLLERTTRHVGLTPEGEAYLARCLDILADVDDAEAAVSGAGPIGMLRVEVQGTLARRFVLPRLPEFLGHYPGIEISLSEGDIYVDPVREGVDCVLRVGTLADSAMIVRRLAELEEVTCCSPAYAARFGRPERWDALEGHRMVAFRSSNTGGILPLEFVVNGVRKTVSLPHAISVDGAASYSGAALAGLGLIQVPRYGVEEALADGRLIAVLTETPPSPSPVSLLYSQDRHLPSRLRVFIDWLAQEFTLARDPATRIV